MLYLPNNRRTYHRPPPAAKWANFDLSKTSDTGKSASLLDGVAVLAPYHLQPMFEKQLFFADHTGKRMYLWGFDEGFEFDLDHLSSSYASRSDVVNNCMFAEMASNGELVAYSQDTFGNLYVRLLPTAFDLSALGAESESFGSYQNVRFCLSADGEKFVMKSYNGNSPAVYRCASAFDYASPTRDNSYNFANYEASVRSKIGISSGSCTWKDFQMSADGKTMIASIKIGDAEVVARLDFATAWTVNAGCTVPSAYVVPSSMTGVQAVMADPWGATLFLFCTGDNRLHEFSLSE